MRKIFKKQKSTQTMDNKKIYAKNQRYMLALKINKA